MASSDGEEQSAILEVTSEEKMISACSKSDSCNNSNDSSLTESNGSLQSPSAESMSAFQDLDRTSELILELGQDIVSKVDNPQKVVEPWGTYVSFRIRTRCRRWDPEEKEYVVRRRYNDFKALHERLAERSLVVVPPLPCRHTLLAQLDRYSRDFVLQRLALLNIFVKRLITHSILSHSDDLKIFLTASQSEMSSHFKSKTSYIASLSDSLYSLASSNSTHIPPSVNCRVRDPEFTSASDYMTSLKDKLEFFASISSRINKERTELVNEMQTLGPVLESWSQIERFNKDTLKRHGSETRNKTDEVVETKTVATTNSISLVSDGFVHLGDILKKMSKPYSISSVEHGKMAKEFPYNLANPVQEYLLYVDAVRAKLRERDGMQAGLEIARDKLAKKGPGTPVANGKLAHDVEDYHDRLQCASEALRSDLHGWHRQKNIDVKLILIEMAKKHMEFYEKSLHSWDAVLPQTSAASSMADSRKTLFPNNAVFLKHLATSLTCGPDSAKTEDRSKESSDWENVENDL